MENKRFLYANKVVKAEERLRFKRLQNDYVYICGGSFNEIHVSNTNKDSMISENIFSRENLCSSNIEIPYYSAGYRNICIFCGGVNLIPLSPLTFPQFVSCGSS